MKGLTAVVIILVAALIATVARSGHEFPVYPSYYPHEIQIETRSPERAADSLLKAKIQGYVGREPHFTDKLPDSIRAIESLGSLVIVRINPESSSTRDNAAACGVARTVVRDIALRRGELIFHPYPITPFDGDYLHHVDLADAAKTRLASKPADASMPAIRRLRVRAAGALVEGLVRPDWYTKGSEWDAEVDEVRVSDLVAPSTTATNGWLGPPWAKTGWFHAALLLARSADDPRAHDRVQTDLQRLETGAYENTVERINLERELVTSLTTSCRSVVVGYTVKREYVSTEYSAGIENIGFDSIEGLNSPIFIRTVKLKDFPWNGWLSLGIDTRPTAAWNPIAGFTDSFGRLMWSAVGDPALLPSPNAAGWMLNRISDVQSNQGR
jgi:hypothetical protein